ncbi:hypothetical protein CC1G_07845 [Coprinopsis cinerea okayama7|uniref:Uncharacterized protein n=1 Tax=Coprinopsis cinerea (strain Okayama-7 / 130 / ATCC MYA-4618 / FGSC 9003) TaxID=240176 RepID=A8P413_COPC7|nr:hypothetical protein CC1G_07845 [Coprinopsis cinerea okayama7\|eukprot:XP_001838654.2 hypothetical protein CC1G_07845 [Coprinopsis cinerea okayama7\
MGPGQLRICEDDYRCRAHANHVPYLGEHNCDSRGCPKPGGTREDPVLKEIVIVKDLCARCKEKLSKSGLGPAQH